MVFPHDEYHIYTTATGIEKRYIHLTEDIVSEAKRLHEHTYGDVVSGDWKNAHHLKVGDNVWLVVGEEPAVLETPSLISYGYEGAETCRAAGFEEPVFFESMIFYMCTIRAGWEWGPDWDIDEVREWAQPEHRVTFDQAFEAYLDESERVLPDA